MSKTGSLVAKAGNSYVAATATTPLQLGHEGRPLQGPASTDVTVLPSRNGTFLHEAATTFAPSRSASTTVEAATCCQAYVAAIAVSSDACFNTEAKTLSDFNAEGRGIHIELKASTLHVFCMA